MRHPDSVNVLHAANNLSGMIPQIVDQYVEAIDTVAPGLLSGLYLTGSIALGDYQPGRSDVDAIAVVSRDLTSADLVVLRNVHETALPDAPHVDAVYLTADRFATQPSAADVAPFSLERSFHTTEPCGQLGPVTWAELARYSVTVRGDEPSDLGVTWDAPTLDAWVRGNLTSYWGQHSAQTRAMLADAPEEVPLPEVSMLEWAVLGPPRLYYTVVTGDIASKTAAGVWAAERFPEHAELIGRCIRSRRGEQISATIGDARAATDLIDAVIARVTDCDG